VWAEFIRFLYLCDFLFLGGDFLLLVRHVFGEETPYRPSFNASRYLEDFLFVKDPSRRTGF